MERFSIVNATEAMLFKIRILWETSLIGATGFKRMIKRSHVFAMSFIARNYTDISISPIWEKFNRNNTSLSFIVRQQIIKVHNKSPIFRLLI